jgi:hypothetical protein
VNEPPEDTSLFPHYVPKLLSKVEKKIWKAIKDGILPRGGEVSKIYVNLFKEALEEDNDTSEVANVRIPSITLNEDFATADCTHPTQSEFDYLFDKLALPFKGDSELSPPYLEAIIFPDSSEEFHFDSLFAEEPREEVQDLVSMLPPIPSSCDLSTKAGPVDTIHLPPILTQPEPTLSLWDEQSADILPAPGQSSINDFIGNDVDFVAVDLMKSSAMSYLGSNRDIPLERDALQDSCQPNVDFFMDEDLFIKFLELENEIHVEWKDKNSGNRAFRQP